MMRGNHHRENWVAEGFLIALGFVLFKLVAGLILLVCVLVWDVTANARPAVRKILRGFFIALGVLAILAAVILAVE